MGGSQRYVNMLDVTLAYIQWDGCRIHGVHGGVLKNKFDVLCNVAV